MKNLFTLIIITFLSFSINAQLISNFTASPKILCVGGTVSFTDLSSSSSGAIQTWAWNFGDGSTSSLTNPTHVYTAPGTYNVTLTVYNGTSSVAEVKPAYILVHPLPVVSFTTPSSACTIPYSPVFSNVNPSSGSFTYNWNFGNGQTSTSQTPTNANFTTAGTYNVSLTVTNTATGCINSFNQNITVASFNSEFSLSPTTVCVGELVNYQDLSTGGANSWLWDFGNGVLSGVQNPINSYSTPGTFTVSLNSQNTINGCSGIITHQIVVNPLPSPSFTGNPLTGCNPLVVAFTNTSSPATGTFNWNFGNGSTFTGANPPNQTYLGTGSYTVSLTQTNAFGCINSTTQSNYIVVSPLVAAFQSDVVDGCEDLDVQFTNLSTSPNPTANPITGWLWNFGNGSTFSGQNPPVQTYPEGVYNVTLTVTTAGGCTQTITMPNYIKVGIPPNVSFTYSPLIACAKSDFDFVSTTPIPPGYDPADVSWNWDFGDGGTNTIEMPTYNYPVDTGYFDVQLIVTLRGCSDTLIIPNAVYVLAPIALFNPVQSLFCNPTSFPVTVNVTDDAILGENTDNVQMIWSWGDGSSTSLVSPALFTNPNQGSMSHPYAATGSYTIQQAVYNYTTGCADSVTRVVHISTIDAEFTLSNDTVCRNFPVTLTNTSLSSHPLTAFNYSMGNGVTLTGANQSYAYSTSGSYTISLQVTNSVGCTNTQDFPNFTSLQQPVASINPSASAGCVPLNVVFSNNSSVAGNGVGLSSFNWTFENGSTQVTNAISQTTNYNFTSTGSYLTTLVATDNFGCVSLPTTITTVLTAPTAAYTLDTVVCNLELFTAVNNSLNFASSQWFLNGTSVSSATNFSSSFSEVNPTNATSINYDVMLIVTDINGCKDTAESVITVSLPQAIPNYIFTGSNVNAAGEFICPPVFADLTDNSTSYGTISQWQWTFGDNNSSTLQNPSNTYVFAGTYTSTLTITDEFGCTNTATNLDYLTIGGPSGNVTWNNIGSLCNPQFQFVPTQLNNVNNIIWDLGNGTTVNNTQNFTYIYPNSGNYFPTALLVDDNNCQVFYTMNPITTTTTPIIPNFSVNPISIPVYDPMTVTQNSTGGTGGLTTWNWFFGNENITNNTGAGFNYEWQYPGQYNVTLIVTDALGCSAQMSIPVYVTAELYIPNVLTANGDGINDLFSLREPVFTSYDIIILNRWGNIVSEMYDQSGTYLWDGRNKSKDMCSEGVYYYKLNGIQYDGVEISTHGFVTLVLGN